MQRIALVPQLSGIGGMVTFRHKLAAGLAKLGIQVSSDGTLDGVDAVLIIGGTRQLGTLWQARRRGVRIVQRLNGMNWIHRLRRTGLRHFLRSEYGNWLLALIRSRLADHIVYQSEFSRQWWERVRGKTPVPNTVVHNGVDLGQYTPQGIHARPARRARILLVEGSLMGGYEGGLLVALDLVSKLSRDLASHPTYSRGVELMVVGRVSPELQQRANHNSPTPVLWAGQVPAESIPQIDRSAHLLYSADINAACPNSVIEALACGLPVLGFDTGALAELVSVEAGKIVPYGGNAWKLDPPDISALARAAVEILEAQEGFSRAARQSAEAAFGLDGMVAGYLHALQGDMA